MTTPRPGQPGRGCFHDSRPPSTPPESAMSRRRVAAAVLCAAAAVAAAAFRDRPAAAVAPAAPPPAAVTGKLARLMWDRRPNFVIHCGDVVDDGARNEQWTGDLFGPCKELFARVPVYPCIGNHEKNHPFYYRYFALPAPEYYYSYRY